MNKQKKISIFVSSSMAIAFCVFMFYNSAQTAEQSSATSGFFVNIFTSILDFFGISADPESLSFYIRKTAHFLSYFMFGLILCYTINCFTKKKKLLLISPAIAFTVALCDEFLIQASSNGRSPEWRDVLIDICGTTLATTIVFCFKTIKEKPKKS